MIPYTQLQLHNPESGVKGDCLRTALACLLEIPPADVPLFHEDDWLSCANLWLAPKGLALMHASPDDHWLPWLHGATGVGHLVIVPSPRFPSGLHAVVGLDGQVVHDVHPSRASMDQETKPTYYLLLVRK